MKERQAGGRPTVIIRRKVVGESPITGQACVARRIASNKAKVAILMAYIF